MSLISSTAFTCYIKRFPFLRFSFFHSQNWHCWRSQIRLNRLSYVLPAYGAVVVGSLQRLLTRLADAQMATGQDHDALLRVLADDAELVLALSLHLFEEQVFHVLRGVVVAVPLLLALEPLPTLQE